MSQPLAIGIDVGGTKIAAALVTSAGEVMAAKRLPSQPEKGYAAVVDVIIQAIESLLEMTPEPVVGVGIGVPGLVNSQNGVVRYAANMYWEDVPLKADLQAFLPQNMPLYVQRDSFAELLGEAYFGAGRGCQDLVYLGLGTGLGGAALADGRLIVGHSFTASEIGHLVIEPNGQPCGSGLKGCAESIVSGTGAFRLTKKLLAEQQLATTLEDSAQLTMAEVIQAAHKGDPLAQEVFRRVGDWLTRILAMYAIIINPQRIIIGGGFGRAAYDLLVPPAFNAVSDWALKQSVESLEIARAELVSSAVGASCLVWQSQQT